MFWATIMLIFALVMTLSYVFLLRIQIEAVEEELELSEEGRRRAVQERDDAHKNLRMVLGE